MSNQAKCIVHNLKPGPIVLDHFCFRKVSKDVLFALGVEDCLGYSFFCNFDDTQI